jgi:hypothetical protein
MARHLAHVTDRELQRPAARTDLAFAAMPTSATDAIREDVRLVQATDIAPQLAAVAQTMAVWLMHLSQHPAITDLEFDGYLDYVTLLQTNDRQSLGVGNEPLDLRTVLLHGRGILPSATVRGSHGRRFPVDAHQPYRVSRWLRHTLSGGHDAARHGLSSWPATEDDLLTAMPQLMATVLVAPPGLVTSAALSSMHPQTWDQQVTTLATILSHPAATSTVRTAAVPFLTHLLATAPTELRELEGTHAVALARCAASVPNLNTRQVELLYLLLDEWKVDSGQDRHQAAFNKAFTRQAHDVLLTHMQGVPHLRHPLNTQPAGSFVTDNRWMPIPLPADSRLADAIVATVANDHSNRFEVINDLLPSMRFQPLPEVLHTFDRVWTSLLASDSPRQPFDLGNVQRLALLLLPSRAAEEWVTAFDRFGRIPGPFAQVGMLPGASSVYGHLFDHAVFADATVNWAPVLLPPAQVDRFVHHPDRHVRLAVVTSTHLPVAALSLFLEDGDQEVKEKAGARLMDAMSGTPEF